MHFGMVNLVAPGWSELLMVDDEGNPESVRILVKLGERAGRTVITRLIIDGELLDSATLRAIPIARIEAAMSHPEFGIPNLKIGHGAYTEEVHRQLTEAGHVFPESLDQLDAALERYLREAPDPGHGSAVRPRRAKREPLERPDGTDPETFYARVAQAYNEFITETHAPAPLIAAEASVPVPTVHRWIAEARRRGFLPPARKGRAG